MKLLAWYIPFFVGYFANHVSRDLPGIAILTVAVVFSYMAYRFILSLGEEA